MIYTCTLNPSLDYYMEFDKVELGKTNRSSLEYYEAGETVELEVYRAQDGEYNAQKISVTLGAKKDAPSTNSSSNQQQNEKNNK